MDAEGQFVVQVTSAASDEVKKLIPISKLDQSSSSLRPATYQIMSAGAPEIVVQTEAEPTMSTTLGLSSSPRGVSFKEGNEVIMRSISDEIDESSPLPLSSSLAVTIPEANFTIRKGGGIQRSMSNRMSMRSAKEKYRKLQRMASMPGDSELTEYMDGLARDPERFSRPHNLDTGETILHLLAKEGKVEILESLLHDGRLEEDIVKGMLMQDRLRWTPVMAATKADCGAKDILEMFIGFLHQQQSLSKADLKQLMEARNNSKDSLFTLLMRDSSLEAAHDFTKARHLLFALLAKQSSPEDLPKWFRILVLQLLEPNSCDLTSRSMKELIDLASEVDLDFSSVLAEHDASGNNMLMDLAKNMKDDALREILTNTATTNFVTHSVLLSKNVAGQTLLTLIEVNRESLSESLPLVLKREYGCHRRDLTKTELCLSEQLETSASAYEIIQELHQLEPKNCCQIFLIWLTLFLTSLTPNIGLAMSDIFSDAYLTVEYHGNWMNQSFNIHHEKRCSDLKNSSPVELEAFAACLSSESQFFYTIAFLLLPLIFYLTEFLTLRPEYEPTGLRQRMITVWKDLQQEPLLSFHQLVNVCKILALTFVTALALILWQPVTAACKFYRDARYQASEGTTRVLRRKEKRFVDLAASRGELIEVSIEAVFEPMVQGYIIFPSIIDIIDRLASSVSVEADGTLKIDFQLKGIETAQIFSIGISMVSLAWCYSEYNSVRKNMLLDITVSPCSRVVMCLYMLLQVIARLLAFMLFTLYWGPGNFYPLMIFVMIHMILAAAIHIIFSEDLAYWKSGSYLKFFHNVMMNSFASIYFHNYLRFDEMPLNRSGQIEFIDSQRPGLHISTFLRQLLFDTLYALEFVVLLSFGFSSEVQDLIDQKRKPILISIILSLSVISVFLRLFYYVGMHVWRNVILSGKKLIRQEIIEEGANNPGIQQKFFKYVFVSRNTWILGSLKHIETTLIVLPKRIIEAIKGRGQDLEYSFNDATRHSPLEFFSTKKLNSLIMSFMCFPLVIFVIALNVVMIILLLVGLVLTIPVAVCVFLYNLKSGFRVVDLEPGNEDALDGANILELPPEIKSGGAGIFQCDPTKTLAAFQQSLLENGGTIDLSRHVEATADEFEVFSVILLSLNRKKHPMKLLILDNCDLTDEKLEKLAPLIVKFEKVTLNGSQKMSEIGWDILGQAIRSPGRRLRKLELKIAKNDDDVMRFRREILLEELKGPTMTSNSLRKIATFMPYLEKIYLDDVFNDNMFSEMLIKSRSDNLIDAWKDLSIKICKCPIVDRQLRCLSVPGCAINDEIMTILSPALVSVRAVHLGRNPITLHGWETLKNALVDDALANGGLQTLTHMSLSMLNCDGSSQNIGSSKYIHSTAMEQLTPLVLRMEEVDVSGQQEIGAEGWTIFANIFRQIVENGQQPVRLKLLKMAGCRVKKETRAMLEDTIAKWNNGVPKLEFGQEDENTSSKRCFCC